MVRGKACDKSLITVMSYINFFLLSVPFETEGNGTHSVYTTQRNEHNREWGLGLAKWLLGRLNKRVLSSFNY